MNLPLDEFFYLSEPWCLHPSVGITTSALQGEGSLSGSPHLALGTCSARARSYLSLWRAGVGPTQGCAVAEGIHLQAHPRSWPMGLAFPDGSMHLEYFSVPASL